MSRTMPTNEQDPFRLPEETTVGLRSYDGPAPMSLRFAAFCIDFAITQGVIYGSGWLVDMAAVRTDATLQDLGGMRTAWALGSFLFLLVYNVIPESTALRGTPGKLAMGLNVTDRQGNQLGMGRATARFLAKLISILAFGIGLIIAPFVDGKRALHDLLAGTIVLRSR